MTEKLVRYIRESHEIRVTEFEAEEIIEKIKSSLLADKGHQLKESELLAALVFSSVETEDAAWRIIDRATLELSARKLLEELAKIEEIDESKRCRIMAVLELVKRHRGREAN